MVKGKPSGKGGPLANPKPPGPVLAVCGWSGSGKTTLLGRVIPVLRERGLTIAALKHDAHGIQVDPEGKDSDVLFRSGANVVLRGPDQALIRSHRGDEGDLQAALAGLLENHDLVLVEGHKGTPLPKVWIASEDGKGPPDGVTDVVATLARDDARPERFLELLDAWLPEAWNEPPVYAGVLVGGRSRRMGRPKQLLPVDGSSILDRTVEVLSSFAERIVLLGEGEIDEGAAGLPRLPDPPGLDGPLAGILGALRWAPAATWILAGCDQPRISAEAVAWLLDQRAPARWAVLPRLGAAGVEPLLALYDARSRGVLEGLASAEELAPSTFAEHPRAFTPHPPAALEDAWRNVNTPEEYERILRESRTAEEA